MAILGAIAIAITACFVVIHISRQNAAEARQAAEVEKAAGQAADEKARREAKAEADRIAAEKAANEAAAEKARKKAEAERSRQEAEAAKAGAERVAADKAASLAAAEKARADAIAAHEAELAKYLNGTFSRKPGIISVAVAASSEDGTLNRHIGEALARRFKTNTVETLPSLFTAEFLADGLFNDTFGGSRAPLERLDLLKSLDGLVLARENVEYSQNPALENTVTAHMHIDVTAMPVAAKGEGETWTFTANGVGFKRDDARSLAEERLIEQIAQATNMFLNFTPSNDH